LALVIDTENSGEATPAVIGGIALTAHKIDARSTWTVRILQTADAGEVPLRMIVDRPANWGVARAARVVIGVAVTTCSGDTFRPPASMNRIAVVVIHALTTAAAHAYASPIPAPFIAVRHIVSGGRIDAVYLAMRLQPVDAVGPTILAPTPFVGAFDTEFRAVFPDTVRLRTVRITARVVSPVASSAVESVREALVQNPFVAISVIATLLTVVEVAPGLVLVGTAVMIAEVTGETSPTDALRDRAETIIIVAAHAALIIYAPLRESATPLVRITVATATDLVVANGGIAPTVPAAPALNAFIVHAVGRIAPAARVCGRITDGEEFAVQALPCDPTCARIIPLRADRIHGEHRLCRIELEVSRVIGGPSRATEVG